MIGKVFYDSKANSFFQVREKADKKDNFLCGAYCTYFSDAKTCSSTQMLSGSYIRGRKLVEALDKMREAKYDGIGWRTRKELDIK